MLTELTAMLRPAGGGVFTVSSGRDEQKALQRDLYDAHDAEEVEHAWRMQLAGLASARVALLGIPSDCGAGLVRGAAFGPSALRRALVRLEPNWRTMAAREGVVDVGDVFSVPHLLSDDMLSPAQIERTRAVLYGALPPEIANALPVSPLSMAERVVGHLLTMNPALRILMMGGDHSVAWPVLSALARADVQTKEPWAIVQFDAHTDLLPERLGVRMCFATWAYHANELVGRNGRLVQLGVRASGHPRETWETSLGVRQFWARDVIDLGDDRAVAAVVDHLDARGVRRVYVSNDIDGTDMADAPSTGAPEPGGLRPPFVHALIRRLGERFTVFGADLVEVAPSVGSRDDARRTCDVGAGYLFESLKALLPAVPDRATPS